MLNFLFWNLRRQRIQELIGILAEEHDVEILILAECDIPRPVLLRELNRRSRSRYSLTVSPSERIAIYTRFPSQWMTPIQDAVGVSIRHLAHPIYGELLVVAAHLPSRLHQAIEDQSFNLMRMRTYIEQAEERFGHRRTLIVGDLNMNPFDSGVVAADGLHGVMDRRTAGRQARVVGGERRRFFYNPMWSRFGDESPGPPGTYYYSGSNQISYFWHIFDQVLIRPDLLPNFRNEELQVITEIGTTSLLTGNGLPNSSATSDHLPILFRLNL